MFNIGLCFKLYIDEKTTKQRIEIIEKFLHSLSILDKKIKVIGIIDSLINNLTIKIIEKYKHIHFLALNKNYGISIATNIGIEYLLNNMCDYIFCSDDDIIIKNKEVCNSYVQAMIGNDMFHLGYYPLNLYPTKIKPYKNNIVRIVGFSGCFYALSKECIQKFGYLPVLDGKYGHEHVFYTRAVTTYQYDILYSSDLLELNPMSIECMSNPYRDMNKKLDYQLLKPESKYFWLSKISNPIFLN